VTFQARRCGFASIVILTAKVLAFGQAAAQEGTAPVTKKGTARPQGSDVWQRSKECAAQADKVRGRKDGLLVDYEKSLTDLAAGLSAAQAVEAVVAASRSGKVTPSVPITVVKGLVNHYSAKYGVCFIKATYMLRNVRHSAGTPLDRTTAVLLIDALGGGLLADLDFSLCYIGGEAAECPETKKKIDDAMNN